VVIFFLIPSRSSSDLSKALVFDKMQLLRLSIISLISSDDFKEKASCYSKVCFSSSE
jgi:hypothetical protein